MSTVTERRLDAAAVKAEAEDRLEEIAEHLWGASSSRNPREMRFGRRGSKSVHLAGLHAGLFSDHEAGWSGDCFEAWAHEALGFDSARTNFRAVVEGLAGFLGMAPDVPLDPALEARRALEREAKEAQRLAVGIAKTAADRETLRLVRERGVPVAGSPAATYLASRGITALPDPAVAVFLPSGAIRAPEMASAYRLAGANVPPHIERPALAVFALDAEGRAVGVQRVILRPDGSAKAAVVPQKPSTGRLSAAFARFPAREGSDGPLLIAEGPETALAIWQATGSEVWAALGSIGSVRAEHLPADQRVIICRDADPEASPADQAVKRLAAELHAAGRDTWIAIPERPEGKGWDFADALLRDGAEVIRRAVGRAQSVGSPRLPLAEAREALGDQLDGVFRWIDRHHTTTGLPVLPAPRLVEAGVGLGKSRAAARRSVARIAELRRQGESRVAVFAAPTHALGREMVSTLQAEIARTGAGLTVAVLPGKEATGPDGRTLCQNLDAIKKARAVLVGDDTICASCPLAASCAWRAGHGQFADIYIVAHARLTGAVPFQLKEAGLDHLIIDESPISATLFGVNGPPVEIAADALIRQPLPDDDAAAADLDDARRQLRDALMAAGPGPLRAESLTAAGITAEIADAARGGEWKRKIEPVGRKFEDLEPNRTITKTARAWAEIARMLDDGLPASGRLTVADDAHLGRTLRVRGLRPIHERWLAAPTVILDATPEPGLLKEIVGPVRALPAIHAEEPFATVRQCRAKSFAKSMLGEEDWWSHDAKTYVRRNRAKLARLIREKARGGALGLVIANRQVVELLRTEQDLPDNVSFAHFNALRGLDEFSGVDWLIVAGRTDPGAEAAARIASAITGRPEEENSDPAKAVRRSIREAEIEQAIGRARGVGRTAENPVEIVVLGNVPLRRPAEAVELGTVWRLPSPAERMAEAGGVVFTSPSHAARAYPGLWPTADHAKKAWAAEAARTRGKTSIEDIPYEEFPLVRLKPKGRGFHAAEARVDPAVVDPRAAVEALLGELAAFEFVKRPQPVSEPEPAPVPSARPVLRVFVPGGRAFLGATHLPPRRPIREWPPLEPPPEAPAIHIRKVGNIAAATAAWRQRHE